jgi:hypothetical protein
MAAAVTTGKSAITQGQRGAADGSNRQAATSRSNARHRRSPPGICEQAMMMPIDSTNIRPASILRSQIDRNERRAGLNVGEKSDEQSSPLASATVFACRQARRQRHGCLARRIAPGDRRQSD